MRVLALVTDAYGGRGGIAKFNRDLLASLVSHPGVGGVVAVPRVVVEAVEGVPPGVDFRAPAAGGKGRYLRAVAGLLGPAEAFNLVVCGHVNLLPLGVLAAKRHRARLLLVVHGIDAWTPPEGALAAGLRRRLLAQVDRVVAVSGVTKERLVGWSGLPAERVTVVPNCIDASGFGPGPKRPDLLARYGLEGKRVVLTLGRMSAAEQYKGFDETMEAVAALSDELPDLAYLLCGDGDDRPRLEAKARALGLGDRVAFAGYVPEAEKVDHYRLADVFAMPGRGEGFGIVYLEALACGVPAVASTADASREAVRDGALGTVVDPDDPASVQAGLRLALCNASGGERRVPDGLAYFSAERFRQRWHAVLDEAAPARRPR